MFFVLALFLIYEGHSQCTNQWTPVGPDDLNRVIGLYNFTFDVSKQNIPYAAIADPDYNGKVSVLRCVNNRWEYVGNRGFSTTPAQQVLIKLDSNDVPFVSYMNWSLPNDSITVMNYTGGQWKVVGQPGVIRGWGDNLLFFDKNNTLYVGNVWGTAASFNGSTWNPVSYLPDGFYRLVFDKNNTPYIILKDTAYMEVVNQVSGARYSVKKYVGGTWQYVGTPAIAPSTCYENIELVIDENNVPVLTFFASSIQTYRFTSGAWNPVGSMINCAWPGATGTRVAIDKTTNQPVVSYTDPNHVLMNWKFDGSVWQPMHNTYFKYNWNGGGPSSGLAVQNGVTYVGFGYLAQYNNGWQILGDTGINFPFVYNMYNSAAIDKKNQMYVAYDGQGTGNCGPVCVKTFVDTAWEFVGPVPSTTNSAYNAYPSMAVDTAGTPYVAYAYSQMATDPWTGASAWKSTLTVRRFNGASWDSVGQTLLNGWGGTARSFSYPSILFDPGNKPYLSFTDGANNNKTRVMTLTGNTWTDVGQIGISVGPSWNPSLAIDNFGTVSVAYTDRSYSNKLTVQRFNGSSWITVGNPGFTPRAAFFPSLVAGPGGILYCSYADSISNANMGKTTVMKHDALGWYNIGPPDFSDGNVVSTSLAKNRYDTLFVAYMDGAHNDRAVVKKFTGNTWVDALTGSSQSTVIGNTSGGLVTLCMDTAGMPIVAYYGLYVKKLDCVIIPPDTNSSPGDTTAAPHDTTISKIKTYCPQLLIHPNLSAGTFYVNHDMAVKHIEIYSMMGEMVYEDKLSKTIEFIDMNASPNGMYIVRIKDVNDNSCLTKIIKDAR